MKVAVRSPASSRALMRCGLVVVQPEGRCRCTRALRELPLRTWAVTSNGSPAVVEKVSVVRKNSVPSAKPPAAGTLAPSSADSGPLALRVNGTRLSMSVRRSQPSAPGSVGTSGNTAHPCER